MNFRFCALGIFITAILISCNNSQETSDTKSSAITNTDTSLEINKNETVTDSNQIIENLQGEWKEPEYPFRRAQFKNTRVKFIEEGLEEEPAFKEYKILKECPYEVNNIKNANPDDVFLVMIKDKTCEIIKISNDNLTLSGYSSNTNNNYKIVYKKMNN